MEIPGCRVYQIHFCLSPACKKVSCCAPFRASINEFIFAPSSPDSQLPNFHHCTMFMELTAVGTPRRVSSPSEKKDSKNMNRGLPSQRPSSFRLTSNTANQLQKNISTDGTWYGSEPSWIWTRNKNRDGIALAVGKHKSEAQVPPISRPVAFSKCCTCRRWFVLYRNSGPRWVASKRRI